MIDLPSSPDSLILTAGDVGRLLGWSRWKAWRWLRTLQPSMVSRFGPKGRQLGITVAQLRVARGEIAVPIDKRIIRRFRDLEDRTRELEARSDVTQRELGALRRRIFPLER